MPDGKFRLVRNHEDRNAPGAGSTALDAQSYDPLGGGGTTTLVVNPFTRELERDFISLSGTIVNCAGGVTPWDSWITVRRDERASGVRGLAQAARLLLRRSGCRRQSRSSIRAFRTWDASRTKPSPSIRTRGSSTRPKTTGGAAAASIVSSPNVPGVLADGGKLQMLAIDGSSSYDTRTGQTVGVRAAREVGEHRQSEPAGNQLHGRVQSGPRARRRALPRLEGCWWGNGAVYFAATERRATPASASVGVRPEGDGGTLTLIFESAGARAARRSGQPRRLAARRPAAVRRRRRRPVPARRHARRADLRLRARTFRTISSGPARRSRTPTRAGTTGRSAATTVRSAAAGIASRSSSTDRAPRRRRIRRRPGEGLTFAIWGPWKNGAL